MGFLRVQLSYPDLHRAWLHISVDDALDRDLTHETGIGYVVPHNAPGAVLEQQFRASRRRCVCPGDVANRIISNSAPDQVPSLHLRKQEFT